MKRNILFGVSLVILVALVGTAICGAFGLATVTSDLGFGIIITSISAFLQFLVRGPSKREESLVAANTELQKRLSDADSNNTNLDQELTIERSEHNKTQKKLATGAKEAGLK